MQDGCKWLFQVKFFSFKSAWSFANVFQYFRKKNILLYLFSEMLLFHFVAFIVHAFIFCLRFSQKQSENQPKNTGVMFYYSIKKHMQKFRYFWRKTNFTRKSHLCPSCTKPFNYVITTLANIHIYFLRALSFLTFLYNFHYFMYKMYLNAVCSVNEDFNWIVIFYCTMNIPEMLWVFTLI